ncbi:hypothetical protein ACH492_22445 [Streptomyces sp. NPDC019443]|uniref:hypothetical protein n=1 Tax=Streptomyces sp. NPDC019443 TaxID=3365061 RepID=UPI003787F78F
MTAADMARVDVPLTRLADEIRALKDKAARDGLLAEQAHLADCCDPLFIRLASEHGDCCSTDADYPEWTPGGERR